jgi:hypothetical protein
LDKKQVTTFIGTIRMHVARSTTLMALRNNIVGDSFAQAVIENKVFTYEFTF